MYTGYSILLGEYIEAATLDYKDCEPFQVICPSCHEPLFKAVRQQGAKHIHYLSHYKKTGLYASECELRVSTISRTTIDKHNSKARDQKLQYFLSVFTSLLKQDPWMSYGEKFDSVHKQINKSKAWGIFRDGCHQSAALSDMRHFETFSSYAADYIKDISDFVTFPKTGFSIATQTRISFDMYGALLTDKCRSNYDALFNHSAMYLVSRIRSALNEPSDNLIDNMFNSTLLQCIERLMHSNKERGIAVLKQMAETPVLPPYSLEKSNFLIKTAAEIAHESIGTLLRLPYFSLLKNAARQHGDTSNIALQRDAPPATQAPRP